MENKKKNKEKGRKNNSNQKSKIAFFVQSLYSAPQGNQRSFYMGEAF